jgi:hypothetical protein
MYLRHSTHRQQLSPSKASMSLRTEESKKPVVGALLAIGNKPVAAFVMQQAKLLSAQALAETAAFEDKWPGTTQEQEPTARSNQCPGAPARKTTRVDHQE